MISKLPQIARNKLLLKCLLVVMVLALSAVSAFAQTPMPTLYIPIPDMIASVNQWTPSLSPIVMLGVGASISMAILLFLGAILIWAFRQFKPGK
jgi:ABC-type proline/glycine betaine transport system permease subunit